MRLLEVEIGILKEEDQEQDQMLEDAGIKIKRVPAIYRARCTVDLDKVSYVWEDVEDGSLKVNFGTTEADVCVYKRTYAEFIDLWKGL